MQYLLNLVIFKPEFKPGELKNTPKYILLFFALSFLFKSYSQIDTLNAVFKPRIGIGTGTLAYFGEIQSYQSGFSATTSRIGGHLYVNAPLFKFLNAEFSATYGKVGANERSLERNFNFESRIRMSSLMLHYNFYPYFSPTRSFFNPYVGVGLGSFEFLSKTDLYAANGMRYHYWDDGSIMDMAQNDPNALNAQPLVRDYIYETDLREQNFDSLGKYKEQSFAIPVSLGAEFHLTPRVDFRIGTTLYYTFTDLIDNISASGEGIRKGDKRNDFLLYSSVGLSYDLEINTGTNGIDDELFQAEFDKTDWDKDGVIDAFDFCHGTPLEALVDSLGCPIDTDQDGVPDYVDEEPNTPLGNHVNKYGMTISKEEFLRWQELMMDSTGLAYGFHEDFSRKEYRNKDGKVVTAAGPKKNYVVIVDKEHKSVGASELHKYLGFREFETITKGDTVYYTLGKYSRIEDAVAAKSSLENQGIEIGEIGKVNRTDTDVIPLNDKVIEKIEKINITEGKALPDYSENQTSFRVLLGEFNEPIDEKRIYSRVDNVTYAKGKDGIIRYYSGSYDTYKEAKKSATELSKRGIDSKVIAYKNQERITLKEAGITILPKGYNEKAELETFVEPRKIDTTQNNNNTPSNVDMSKVKYQVLLGSYEENIPIDIVQIYMSIGGVKPEVNESGTTKYFSRVVNTQAEAEELIKSYESYQLSGMQIVVLFEGKHYTLEEFEKIK